MAEVEGFEPTGLFRVRSLSKRVHSAALPHFLFRSVKFLDRPLEKLLKVIVFEEELILVSNDVDDHLHESEIRICLPVRL
jgi:hypothetical protein